MTRISVFCFVLLSVVVAIRTEQQESGGQDSSPHFCEILEKNDKRIDYSLNVPHRTFFNNYIVAKGFFWRIVMDSSAVRRNRKNRQAGGPLPPGGPPPDSTTDSSTDPPTDLSADDTDTPPSASGAPVGPVGGELKLKFDPYGYKFPTTQFFETPFRCAFALTHALQSDKNVIAGITVDYKQVYWASIPEADINSTGGPQNVTNGGINDSTPDYTDSTPDPNAPPLPPRKRRQSKGPLDNVLAFNTSFGDYKPQVAFSTLNYIGEIVSFIETRPEGQNTYSNRFQAYSLHNKGNEWQNETRGGVQQPFRRRRRQTNKKIIPTSVWETAKSYVIKGFFSVNASGSNLGIILFEICSKDEMPCTGDIVYKYCIVADDEQTPTDATKPCHPSKLQLLFDCTIDWRTTVPPVEGQSLPSDGSPSGSGGPDSDSGSPVPDGSASPSQEPSKSMAWLWILIILIIIIIIIIIILCLCCRKSKGKEPQGGAGAAPASSAASASGAGQPSPKSSVKSKASGTGKSASGSGLPKSPSTLSTASTRSKMSSGGTN